MSRSRAWSATRDPTPGPRATRPARRTESREAAWRFVSFQRDEIRGEVMDIGIPPLREHVDMPLQWIGDDDLGDRIVSGEALVRTVRLSQRDDEGGDVIEISRNGLPRGQRHRYRRRRPFRRCRPGRPATEAPAAATGHDQVLNRLGIVLRADGGEVSARRVTLRAVSHAVEISFPFLAVAHQDIEGAGGAAIGQRLAVQPGSDVGDLRRTQREFWHTAAGNPVLDDRRDELAVLIGENHLVTNQVRSRLSAPAVRAVAEAAIALEELLAARDLFGRSRRTLRIVRSTLRRSLRSSHCCGTSDDHTAEEPKASP